MTSFLGKITKTIIRSYTYPYRKNHLSLSRSIKLKRTPYKCPKGYEYQVESFGGIKVETIRRNNCETNTVIVHLHGGGCTTPMNNLYRKVAKKYCNLTGLPVVSIDYNIGENRVHPALLDDCFTAYTEMLKEYLKDKKIIMVGDSNGANLMFAICFKLRDNGYPLPAGHVVVSPFVDFSASGDSYRKNCHSDPLYSLPKRQKFEDWETEIRRFSPYCGDTDKQDPYLSPAFGDFTGINRILIQVGSVETSESDSDMLYEKAVLANVPVVLQKYDGMFHDFQYLTPFLKESKQAWKEIVKFIKEL